MVTVLVFTGVLGEVKGVQLLLEGLSLLTIEVKNGDITDQTQGLSTLYFSCKTALKPSAAETRPSNLTKCCLDSVYIGSVIPKNKKGKKLIR